MFFVQAGVVSAEIQPPSNAAAVLGEKTEGSLDALKKASQYSFDNGGIGILIGYGKGNGEGITPEYVGDAFVKEIVKRGERAKYFYYNANWEGMTVEYHIGHSALGPWGVDDAASRVSEAVEYIKAARTVYKAY